MAAAFTPEPLGFNPNRGRPVFAPCACGFHDLDAIERRYRFLIRAMRWAACLSSSEAACAIRDLKHDWPGGEAVSHFGGPLRVILAAIEDRRTVRIIYKLYPLRGANQ